MRLEILTAAANQAMLQQRARPAMANGACCAARSKVARAASIGQRHTLRCAQQAARAACAAAGSNAAEANRKLRAGFGTFSGQAAAIGLASASEIGCNSEQWLEDFGDGGKEERKIWI